MRFPRIRFRLRPRLRMSTMMLVVAVAASTLALVIQQDRAARREAALRAALRADFDRKLAELIGDLRDLRREKLLQEQRAFLRAFLRGAEDTSRRDVRLAYSKDLEARGLYAGVAHLLPPPAAAPGGAKAGPTTLAGSHSFPSVELSYRVSSAYFRLVRALTSAGFASEQGITPEVIERVREIHKEREAATSALLKKQSAGVRWLLDEDYDILGLAILECYRDAEERILGLLTEDQQEALWETTGGPTWPSFVRQGSSAAPPPLPPR